MKVCCFIGHRKIEINEELINNLSNLIKTLILEKGVYNFLFGSRSDFDSLCYKLVSKLKEKYPYLTRIFVRGEYEYINCNYKNYLLKSFEDTFFPDKVHGAGRLSYVLRNEAMIDKSDYCIFYYKEDYTPITKSRSGTKLALDYAKQKKKDVFIIC